MIVNGTCRICGNEKPVIDTMSICSDCIVGWMKDPGVSEETRTALKWTLNMQYGAFLRNRTNKKFKSNEMIH